MQLHHRQFGQRSQGAGLKQKRGAGHRGLPPDFQTWSIQFVGGYPLEMQPLRTAPSEATKIYNFFHIFRSPQVPKCKIRGIPPFLNFLDIYTSTVYVYKCVRYDLKPHYTH